MRISDWSSDVCSSDLTHDRGGKSAPTHHRQSRLTMAHGHSRNYTTLTDATDVQSWRQGFRRRLTYSYARVGRSEEHTSELQSLMRISYAVFCLKKKKQKS